jgi:hypothetical protein
MISTQDLNNRKLQFDLPVIRLSRLLIPSKHISWTNITCYTWWTSMLDPRSSIKFYKWVTERFTPIPQRNRYTSLQTACHIASLRHETPAMKWLMMIQTTYLLFYYIRNEIYRCLIERPCSSTFDKSIYFFDSKFHGWD